MPLYVPRKSFPDIQTERSWNFNLVYDGTNAYIGPASSIPLFIASRDTVIDEIRIRAATPESSANRTIAFFRAGSGVALASGTQVTTFTAVSSSATTAPGLSALPANTVKVLTPKDYTGSISTGAQSPASEGIISSNGAAGTRRVNIVRAGEVFGFVTYTGSTPSANALGTLNGLVITILSHEQGA